MIEVGGEKFSGLNKPKRTPSHPTKSHAVAVRNPATGKPKLIRFGSQGAKCSPKGSARNKAWRARHQKNINTGPMRAAYWAAKVKW